MSLTLSTPKILDLVMDAIKVRVPFLTSAFTTSFTDERCKLNQTVMARITRLPTVQDYNASTGYKNGATAAESVIDEVPVTIDQHKHVPIKLDFLTEAQTSEQIRLLDEATSNAGHVLAKSIVDYALSKAVFANFKNQQTSAVADSDKDVLSAIRKNLNKNGANSSGRFGIVNSDVFETLDSDPRITSKDYYDQRIGADGLGLLRGVSGFANIYEYPDLPANGETLTGFFGSKESMLIATRLPRDTADLAKRLNIPAVMQFHTKTDADTGLTLLGIRWMEQGTGDIYDTVALMYGATAGAQGGSAGALTDKAGYLLNTTAQS